MPSSSKGPIIAGYGKHVLEFTIETPGLQAYVIRFG